MVLHIFKFIHSPVGAVMAVEILHQHFKNSIRIGWIRACVTHRTAATIQILPHYHWYLPHSCTKICELRFKWIIRITVMMPMLTRIALGRTRRNHAIVEDFIVQGIWPAGRTIFVHGHRWVIREIGVVQHFEHFIAANGKEWGTHATNVGQFYTTIGGQDFTLASHFTGPFLLRELFAEAMTVCVCVSLRKEIIISFNSLRI